MLNLSALLCSAMWCVAATLPGMWDRTITIGSAGKTFSVTGWKLGWSIGPKHLIQCLCMVHQNCNYTCPTPLQVMTIVRFPAFLPRCMKCRRGIAMRILSVCPSVRHTRDPWQNGRKIGPDFYTVRKNIYPSFLRRRMVGRGRPLLREILG